MKTDIPVPLTKCAFDDPATRHAHERARRKALRSVLLRVGVWLALLVVAKVVESDSQLIEGTAAFLLIPAVFLPLGPAKALLWMRSVEGVLRSFPWQHCAVLRSQDARTAVQLRLADGADEAFLTPVMAARTWRRRKRWSGEPEDGAWFAGAPDRGGVIARPGGHGVMTLQCQESRSGAQRTAKRQTPHPG
ncbi:hypothetical protein [Streptomyces sp. NPDC048650]|uniref:hypothetical protein n=1 Tax=unclassified Streptomyces TaxID=2593676 RepID=UPI0037140AB4